MNGGEQFFVRNHRGSAALDDPDASNLDLLIIAGSKFAVVNFKNDEIGTATTDPEGSGCGFAIGTIGKVGNVLTVEQFSVFDSVRHSPMKPGKAAGILGYDADGNATLSDSMYDGTFRKIGRDRLPSALRQYTDKLAEADRAFRINLPF